MNVAPSRPVASGDEAPAGSASANALAGAADPGAAGRHRLHELDGLRGWAALAVVAFHLFYETFGALFPAFRNPLTRTFDGSFAVAIFFVLSGEALSAPVFAGGGARAIAALAIKRHSRLSIPILATVLLVIGLQRAHLVFNLPAAAIVGRADWLGHWLQAPVGWSEGVRYALLRVYFTTDSAGHLVPFLWTMCAEMLGSIFVFALLGLWGGLRRPQLVLVALILFCDLSFPSGFLACFAAGVLFGSWRRAGRFARWRASRPAQATSLLLITASLVAAWATFGGEERVRVAAAIVLVGALHVHPLAGRFLGAGVSRLLGQLSFPLYLVQFPVLVSFTSWAILWAARHGGLTEARAAGIAVASIALSLAGAAAFEPVEMLTRRIGHRLAAALVLPRG